MSKGIGECKSQIDGWRGGRGGTEGYTRPTNDGGGHREKERGSEGGIGTHRSGEGGARWDGHRRSKEMELAGEASKRTSIFPERLQESCGVVEDDEILDVQGVTGIMGGSEMRTTVARPLRR